MDMFKSVNIDLPLRDQAKNSSKRVHKYVENLPIMKQILSSSVKPDKYYNYLIQIQAIYRSIENNKCFDQFNLRLDCDKLCQNDINQMKNKFLLLDQGKIFEITNIYCQNIDQINNPDLLAAHIYVRYMADLMGGKIIKNIIKNRFPTSVYDLDLGCKDVIVDYINNKVRNKELFLSEVTSAFMSYASILQLC